MPALLVSTPAGAQELPRVAWQSEARLWWDEPWLDWDVVGGTTSRCSIDGQESFACGSPWELNKRLRVAHEGVHEVSVTPLDNSVDPTVAGEPLTVQVGVDRTPPTLSLARSDTRGRVRTGEPMTVWATSDYALSGVAGLSCTVLARDVHAEGDIDCSTTLADGEENYAWLPEDGYELRAQVSDRAGNTSLYQQTSWIVDGSTPNAAMHRRHPQLVLRRSTPPLYFSGYEFGPDAVSSSRFTMRSRIGLRRSGPDGATWRVPDGWTATGTGEIGRFSRRIHGMLPGTTYCVETEAVDELGNRQAWRFRRCLVRAQDDRALRTSRGWRATSPRGAHRKTAVAAGSPGRRAWVRAEGVHGVHLRALR